MFARKLEAQRCAEGKRVQGGKGERVQAGTARPGKTGPTTVIIYCTAQEGIQILAVRSLCTAHCGLLIPHLGPGTAVVQVSVVALEVTVWWAEGTGQIFFSLKLVCVASLMLIMVTNICSLKLLHVSNPMMNCEEKKSLIFTKESLFPL